jgi:hypothetical protein
MCSRSDRGGCVDVAALRAGHGVARDGRISLSDPMRRFDDLLDRGEIGHNFVPERDSIQSSEIHMR